MNRVTLSSYWEIMNIIDDVKKDWFFNVDMCIDIFKKLYSKAIDTSKINLDIKTLDNKKMVKITNNIVEINWEKYICISDYLWWL